MSIWCSCLILLYFSISVFSGLTSIKDCELPSKNIDHLNYFSHNVSLVKDVNKYVVQINYTVKRVTPTLSFHMRGYKLIENEKKEDFNIKNANCKNPLIKSLLKKLKLKYSQNNCTGYPGNYYVPKLYLSHFSSLYKYSTQNVKSYIMEIDFVTSKGSVLCGSALIDLTK